MPILKAFFTKQNNFCSKEGAQALPCDIAALYEGRILTRRLEIARLAKGGYPYLEIAHELGAATVEGTPIEGADIKYGSFAVSYPNMEIRYGDACLVCFGIDEAAIKYVYPLPGSGLRIESADPSYKKHLFTKEEVEGGLVRVVGPVATTIWMGRPKRGI